MRLPGAGLFWTAAVAASVASPAHADAFRTQPLKAGSPVSVQGYGQQNPACREWTNGCVLCLSEGGRAQCSTPGIACVPAGITCKRMAK